MPHSKPWKVHMPADAATVPGTGDITTAITTAVILIWLIIHFFIISRSVLRLASDIRVSLCYLSPVPTYICYLGTTRGRCRERDHQGTAVFYNIYHFADHTSPSLSPAQPQPRRQMKSFPHSRPTPINITTPHRPAAYQDIELGRRRRRRRWPGAMARIPTIWAATVICCVPLITPHSAQ